MNIRKIVVTVVLFAAAVVLGLLAGNLCQNVPFLSWLNYAIDFGIPTANPFVLDLSVVQLAFGLYFSINVAQIIFIIIAIFMYKPMLKRL